jgi:glycosyltransferase involved in cell wall biosynthesis
MKLSIIIPVYNEERTLEKIIDHVQAALNNLPQQIDQTELIMVNDGSKDRSSEIMKSLVAKHSNIRAFEQPMNMGKGAALIRGFKESTGDIVLIQDADLEYDPKDYPLLLAPFFNNNADAVYGSRFKGECSRVLYYWHYLGNQFLTTLSNAFTNLNMTDMETCYKAFKGEIIRSMILTSHRFGIEPEMTAKISKLRDVIIYEVPISYHGRTYGEGKKIGWKDGVSAIWCIIKFNIFTSYQQSFRSKS